MLEKYFLRLSTLDRIRGSWIGPATPRKPVWHTDETLLTWLAFL
jgi:hypothetical protein